jgi:outer membrane protein assembly factor BamB
MRGLQLARLRLGRVALVLCLLAILGVRVLDIGDRGMSNVFTGLLLVAAALGLLLAFVLRRSLPLRLRFGVLAALAVLFLAGSRLLRIEGVSGEMIPRVAWRSGARPSPWPEASGRVLALDPPARTDFPAFLGARRDNRVADVRLARDWNARPPRLRWRAPIGAGWSAFAVAGGWAFTLEQDERGQRASARSLADGALVWSVELDTPFEHVLGGGGPRATPTVELDADGGDGRVYVQSAWGVLACLSARSGARLWAHDLREEHGLTRARENELVQYGRSGSPLVVGELVIVPAGGEPGAGQAGLVAFEKQSGALRWAGPARNVSYSSPVCATLAGVPQVLCVNEDTLSAHRPEDGALLWEHPWPGSTSGDANVSQAVPLGQASVFVSKGYGGGGLALVLEASGDGGLAARELWHDSRSLRTKFTNVVVHAGFVYGLDDGMLECVELATGARRWKEGRYGHGQILLAGERLLVCSEDTEVHLLDPDPERPNDVLGSFQALDGKCWAHLALAGGVLLLRNDTECAAWELPLEP